MKSTEKSLTQKDLNTICEYCGDYGKEVCSICPIERLRQKLVVRAMKSAINYGTIAQSN